MAIKRKVFNCDEGLWARVKVMAAQMKIRHELLITCTLKALTNAAPSTTVEAAVIKEIRKLFARMYQGEQSGT